MTAPGHEGSIFNCPECARAVGWQEAWGLRFAAQQLRHEARSEEDLDLAELCEYTADTHHVGQDMVCKGCGERWYSATDYPNVGGVRCQAYIDVQQMKDMWVIRQVQVIQKRWAHV